MGKNKNFIENNSFDGTTQIAGKITNITNNISKTQETNEENAKYMPEPIWRSALTKDVLTWISTITGVLGLLPLGKMAGYILNMLKGTLKNVTLSEIEGCFWGVILLSFVFMMFMEFRRITTKETRHPLFFNLALSGYGKRLTLEKIHIDKCPKCGGEMKYYNKPIEWIDRYYSDGKVKREVIRKIQVLECKRNSNHYYEVDAAEDKLS